MAPEADGPGGATPGEHCSSCGSSDLTRLPMVLTDGTDVTFVSCHVCERREWWSHNPDGSHASLPIETVLERSAKRPR